MCTRGQKLGTRNVSAAQKRRENSRREEEKRDHVFGIFVAARENCRKTCLSGEKLAAKTRDPHDRIIGAELGKRRASC